MDTHAHTHMHVAVRAGKNAIKLVLGFLPTKLCFSVSHSGAARTPLATKAKNAFLTCKQQFKWKIQLDYTQYLCDFLFCSWNTSSISWSTENESAIILINDQSIQLLSQAKTANIHWYKPLKYYKNVLLVWVLYDFKFNIFGLSELVMGILYHFLDIS